MIDRTEPESQDSAVLMEDQGGFPVTIMRSRQLLQACAALPLLALSACTSTNVRPVDAQKYQVNLVCIERNPKVQVGDMISVLESGFARHNIQTSVYENTVPGQCEYTLWYTAFRGWDLAPFLRSAELRLRYKGIDIASASYDHAGGFALNKWASTETKLNPVIDELLAGFAD